MNVLFDQNVPKPLRKYLIGNICQRGTHHGLGPHSERRVASVCRRCRNRRVHHGRSTVVSPEATFWFEVVGKMRAARWVIAEPDPELLRSTHSTFPCPEPIARLLAARGITDPKRFFEPTSDDLHAPARMLGMAAAVARIQRAVGEAEPILIYGDYDVDGTTATVLLKTAIERIALPANPAKVTYHVPHRLREGYGIQNVRLAEAAGAGIRLVISVDTGIRAFAAAEEAKALGLDLIVTDHHLPGRRGGSSGGGCGHQSGAARLPVPKQISVWSGASRSNWLRLCLKRPRARRSSRGACGTSSCRVF